jgi:hypothetical protein
MEADLAARDRIVFLARIGKNLAAERGLRAEVKQQTDFYRGGFQVGEACASLASLSKFSGGFAPPQFRQCDLMSGHCLETVDAPPQN